MLKFLPALNSTKRLLKEWYPEIWLILILATGMLNPISLSVVALLIILIVTKKPVLGLIIGLVFILGATYLALAVYSEFKEFEHSFSEYRALELAAGGFILVGIIVFPAAKMISKYFRKLNALPH